MTILRAAACAAAAAWGFCAQIGPPQVPRNLRVPAGQSLVLQALGRGTQMYVCKPGSAGKFEWVLEAPDATLYNEAGEVIGKHYAGPTWEALDASKVTGRVQQIAPGRSPDAVPWQLVKSISNRGTGTFAHISYIQRIDTAGGRAPDIGCDASHSGDRLPVKYRAMYLFYSPRP